MVSILLNADKGIGTGPCGLDKVFMPENLMHYNDVRMSAMGSQITSLTTVYSYGYSGADKRKLQSSVSLTFARGIHRWPVNSPHKGPVTRKMFPFDDVIIFWLRYWMHLNHVIICDYYLDAVTCLLSQEYTYLRNINIGIGHQMRSYFDFLVSLLSPNPKIQTYFRTSLYWVYIPK